MKYGINAIDARSEVPWEEKSIYVFYVDLAAGKSYLLDFISLIHSAKFISIFVSFQISSN